MSFIKPDDIWMLWMVLVSWAAISIYIEQTYKWGAKVSGAIIGLLGALILANFNIIPSESPVYDAVWSYIVPLSVPLLLFKANVKKIFKESGKMFLAFNISAIGTVIGVIVSSILLCNVIPDVARAGAMMTGSYIGGGVNFVSMSEAFNAPKNTINALIVADNLNMAFYFMILMSIPTLGFFKRYFKYSCEMESEESENNAASYWSRKEISLLDIAKAMGVTFIVVALSVKFTKFINASNVSNFIKLIFGQKYLIITTFTMILATAFPKFIGEIKGAEEIGTFMIYIFFVVIGAPANLKIILMNSPILFVFCALIVIINMIVTFTVGKFLNISIEELCCASNANIGGPTTAAAMAIGKGWTKLVIPSLLVGIWGYVIGNYIGLFNGQFLINFIGK